MPPRQNEPILGPLDVRYEPVTLDYDTRTGTYTDGYRYYDNNTATRATINTDGLEWKTAFLDDCYITKEELSYQLDNILQKVCKVITDHIKLDITEEEFMKLVREE